MLRGRADPEPFAVGELVIDYERRRVSVAGRPVHLTATEFELLRLLSVNAGRVMTSKSLLRQLRGERDGIRAKQVRSFVRKLRGKLGDDARHPTWIFNERGVGYRMAPAGPTVRGCSTGPQGEAETGPDLNRSGSSRYPVTRTGAHPGKRRIGRAGGRPFIALPR